MSKKWKIFFLLPLFILFLFFIYIAFYFIYPNVSRYEKENPKKTSFMEYREEESKAKGKTLTINQSWVSLSRISPYLVEGILIAEDDKFYFHEGFDYEAIQKAIEKDLKEKKFKIGASTITQQLVKNLFLNPSKNPIRKLKEAILTWRIEKKLSKQRILELYLNVIEWGDGIFGIEAASQYHYNKSAKALTMVESSRLVAVVPNPRKYNPKSHSKYVENRSRIILRRMMKRGLK